MTSNISQIHYSKDSLTWWLKVKKLFKGKGIYFFRGYIKGVGLQKTESELTLLFNLIQF